MQHIYTATQHWTNSMSERKPLIQTTSSLTSLRSPTSECVTECAGQAENERWRTGKQNGGQKVTAIRLEGKGVLFPTDRDLPQSGGMA